MSFRPGVRAAAPTLHGKRARRWRWIFPTHSVWLPSVLKVFPPARTRDLTGAHTGAGLCRASCSLLITREWAILADENDYTTATFQQITGRPPRPVAEFLHQYRAEFL